VPAQCAHGPAEQRGDERAGKGSEVWLGLFAGAGALTDRWSALGGGADEPDTCERWSPDPEYNAAYSHCGRQ
jgi:hypothetical protein